MTPDAMKAAAMAEVVRQLIEREDASPDPSITRRRWLGAATTTNIRDHQLVSLIAGGVPADEARAIIALIYG